jgi:DNA-binding NarL/FixJ family response regulator
MRRLKIFVIEDHPLMLEAIRVSLSTTDEFEIVSVAESGEAAVEVAERVRPDVVLLDLRLPGIDGLEVLRRLHQSGLDTRIVVLSACDEAEIVDLALRAGACAFITKRIDPHDLAAALRQALDQTLFQPFRVNPLVTDGASPEPVLSDRELSVLRAVADGMSNKEIAKRLAYAEQTVKLDLTRVYRKLGVSNRTEALAVAYRKGLLDGRLVEFAPTTV